MPVRTKASASATDLLKIYRWFFGFSDGGEGNKKRAELKTAADDTASALTKYLKKNVTGLSAGFSLSAKQHKAIRMALDDLNFEPLNPYPQGQDCW